MIQFSVMMYRNATIHIIIKERLKTGASFTATTTARIRSTTHRLINRRKRSRSILLLINVKEEELPIICNNNTLVHNNAFYIALTFLKFIRCALKAFPLHIALTSIQYLFVLSILHDFNLVYCRTLFKN